MFYLRRSLVFLSVFVYVSRSVYPCIFYDYIVLSAASAYAEKSSHQEEISGNGNYFASHIAYDRSLVGGYDTGRQAAGRITRILHTGGGAVSTFFPSMLLRPGRQIRMERSADREFCYRADDGHYGECTGTGSAEDHIIIV